MDKSKFKEAMRPFKDPAPSVGIFWVDVENEDLRDVQNYPLDLTSKEKGDITIHNTHKSLRNQAQRRKEKGLSYDSYYFQDYPQIPRGRVW